VQRLMQAASEHTKLIAGSPHAADDRLNKLAKHIYQRSKNGEPVRQSKAPPAAHGP